MRKPQNPEETHAGLGIKPGSWGCAVTMLPTVPLYHPICGASLILRSGQVSGYFRPNLVASVRRFSQKMSQSCTQIDTEIVKETRTFCNDYISLWILIKN